MGRQLENEESIGAVTRCDESGGEVELGDFTQWKTPKAETYLTL